MLLPRATLLALTTAPHRQRNRSPLPGGAAITGWAIARGSGFRVPRVTSA